jgi:shikimate dehydrogenase
MKAAVLGSPIAHSLSPVLHRAAYQALGLTDWSYEAIDCDETGLPALLAGCGLDWAGLSLTMPLKRTVLPMLDSVDPLTRDTGAANTVVFAGGHRYGYNTDVPGMIAAPLWRPSVAWAPSRPRPRSATPPGRRTCSLPRGG